MGGLYAKGLLPSRQTLCKGATLRVGFVGANAMKCTPIRVLIGHEWMMMFHKIHTDFVAVLYRTQGPPSGRGARGGDEN